LHLMCDREHHVDSPGLRSSPDIAVARLDLCRCTGYQHIVDATKLAAERLRR